MDRNPKLLLTKQTFFTILNSRNSKMDWNHILNYTYLSTPETASGTLNHNFTPFHLKIQYIQVYHIRDLIPIKFSCSNLILFVLSICFSSRIVGTVAKRKRVQCPVCSFIKICRIIWIWHMNSVNASAFSLGIGPS